MKKALFPTRVGKVNFWGFFSKKSFNFFVFYALL